MESNLDKEEISELKELLTQKHIKISTRKIKRHLDKIVGSNPIFPLSHQRALLVQLLENYESTKKKEVIFLEELEEKDIPPTFVLGALAEDWPGMSNSILGIVHHKERNVLFIKGFTLEYKDKTLGLVVLAFQLKNRGEYKQFLQEKKELIREIKDAARGSTAKYRLLDDEAVKYEIYNKIMKKSRDLYHNSDLVKIFEESGEVFKFVSSRSREYLEERKIKDLVNLILENYISQNTIKCGKTPEVIKIKNFETKYEELTGITFVCRDHLFSIEDFLKTLEYIVPGHIIRHHKSYVTEDGILVYRIEIVDRNENPLNSKHIKNVEVSMEKLITSTCSKELTKLKSVGGFEHYSRAIIPFLSEELKRTNLTQVFINVDRRTEFLMGIKLVIVAFKSKKKRIYSLISGLSVIPGIDINSTIPPKVHGNKIEISLLKLEVNLAEFKSIKEIYSTIKEIVEKIYGDIRDFDEGFRDIYMKILNQLMEKLETVDPALIREIFFNIDELSRVEFSSNTLLEELIKLCADIAAESKKVLGDKILFKYKHIVNSNRTIIIISSVKQKRLLSRLVQKIKDARDMNLFFTKIEWDQRSYLIMILSKNNRILEDDFIQYLMDKVHASAV